jgi:hypothetical protein
MVKHEPELHTCRLWAVAVTVAVKAGLMAAIDG